jgi:hypothetical protein
VVFNELCPRESSSKTSLILQSTPTTTILEKETCTRWCLGSSSHSGLNSTKFTNILELFRLLLLLLLLLGIFDEAIVDEVWQEMA